MSKSHTFVSYPHVTSADRIQCVRPLRPGKDTLVVVRELQNSRVQRVLGTCPGSPHRQAWPTEPSPREDGLPLVRTVAEHIVPKLVRR